MRKLLKILGWLVAGLVAVLAVFASVIYTKSNAALKKTYTFSVAPVAIPTDAASIAHGKHLAATRGCMDCHGKDFAGAKIMEDGAMGTLYGPNLTTGKGGRMSTFKDEDWVRAIRHGVGPDGLGLFVMPSEEYRHLSDSDLGALIAYLKTVPAVDRERVPTAPGPVARGLLAFSTGKMIAADAIDHAQVKPPVTVAKAATADYGRYIAAACVGCHGTNYSGGKIEIGPPDWPHAANLTPHGDGRVGKWSEAEFIATLRTMKRPDGTAVNPVMPATFGGMDDVELKALWAYFKTLPPVATGVR